MKNKDYSVILNLFVVIFEIVGISLYIYNNSSMDLQYYTHDSNVLALIASSIFLFFIVKGKELPKWASLLKYTSTLALTLTFFTVLFILVPMDNFNYKFYFLNGSMLYFHLICPVLAVISFVFFESHKISGIRDIIRSLYYTLIYTIIMIILNIANIVDGPYPFLRVRSNSVAETILWLALICCGTIVLSMFLQKINSRNRKSIN